MQSSQKIDTITIIFIIILGLLFFGLSISIFKNLDTECPNSFIRNSWAVIQALGSCMIAGGAAYFICVVKSKSCYKGDETGRRKFLAIFGLFFLAILGISIGILIEYNKLSKDDITNCDSNNTTKNSTIFVTVVSSLGLLASIILSIRKKEL